MTVTAPAPALVVLLRAVNVGGRTVRSADLVAAATDLGHTSARTWAASGNLVLVPRGRAAAAAVGDELSAALAERLGFAVPVLVRTRAQLDAVVAGNPFPRQADEDAGHLAVVFWDGPADAGAADADLSRYGREELVWRGAETYAWYRDGIGRSRLTLPVLQRVAGRTGTARNWRTVLKLRDLAAAA